MLNSSHSAQRYLPCHGNWKFNLRWGWALWGYNLHTPCWGLCLAGGIGFLSKSSEVGGELLLTLHGGTWWKQGCRSVFFTNPMQLAETRRQDVMEVGKAHVHPLLLNCCVKGKSWLRYTVILHKTQCKAASVLRGRYMHVLCAHPEQMDEHPDDEDSDVLAGPRLR